MKLVNLNYYYNNNKNLLLALKKVYKISKSYNIYNKNLNYFFKEKMKNDLKLIYFNFLKIFKIYLLFLNKINYNKQKQLKK
jgi:hypothetical protein